MSEPRIEVHIDELMLHGFPPGDGRTAAQAIRREVARTLASRGVANAQQIAAAVARATGNAVAPRPPSRTGGR